VLPVLEFAEDPIVPDNQRYTAAETKYRWYRHVWDVPRDAVVGRQLVSIVSTLLVPETRVKTDKRLIPSSTVG
jgi:hypothetical protein